MLRPKSAASKVPFHSEPNPGRTTLPFRTGLAQVSAKMQPVRHANEAPARRSCRQDGKKNTDRLGPFSPWLVTKTNIERQQTQRSHVKHFWGPWGPFCLAKNTHIASLASKLNGQSTTPTWVGHRSRMCAFLVSIGFLGWKLRGKDCNLQGHE